MAYAHGNANDIRRAVTLATDTSQRARSKARMAFQLGFLDDVADGHQAEDTQDQSTCLEEDMGHEPYRPRGRDQRLAGDRRVAYDDELTSLVKADRTRLGLFLARARSPGRAVGALTRTARSQNRRAEPPADGVRRRRGGGIRREIS